MKILSVNPAILESYKSRFRLIKFIFFLLFYYPAFSQPLSLFDIDTTGYPNMKVKFYAFDKDGKQIINFNTSDFEIAENGEIRKILSVSCPEPKPPKVFSVAMSIDVSGSMSYSGTGEIPVELGKITAKEICGKVSMPPSEFALQTCDSRARILQDFTSDRNVILTKIEPIKANGDNDFVEHLLNPLTGLLNIAKNGKHDKVAILYTDAWWYPLRDVELKQCIDTCKKYGIRFFAIIYTRPEAQTNGIKKSLQFLTDATGGILLDGVTTITVAREIGALLQSNVQETVPCTIEWESGVSCEAGITNVEFQITNLNLSTKTTYKRANRAVAKLEFNPASIKFINPEVGIKKDTIITVTAHNSDFTVTGITSNNPAFTITPANFVLNAGQSKQLLVSYFPADSGFNYCNFEVSCSPCPAKFYASGGWKGKKPKIRTLKLIHPNGGEVFVAGSDTLISWDGVSPDEPVEIEYSTDNGNNWILIASNVKSLAYKWHVPKTPSNSCLARVTAKAGYKVTDYPEVEICNQVWMGVNLDVEFYRNGDSIPEVTDHSEWRNLKTGAWCYYENDPANGKIYGKLYNWYAVNDPRGLAPEGWHIPSDEEWDVLENCLGGTTVTGGKLKSTGTIATGDGLWLTPNSGATNESQFTAHPGGSRSYNGMFTGMSINCKWWSSTENGDNALYRLIYYHNAYLNRSFYQKVFGLSVRCIRD